MKSKHSKHILWLSLLFAATLISCDPEAVWHTKNVTITMQQDVVSAGFAEYRFSTNRDAYYLVACEPVDSTRHPFDKPKQFMMLALDSANTAYINWRNRLLKEGEFNIAPFSSHMLQYGAIDHFFTNLYPETDYWIYAFVVDPDKLEPAGKLYIETITTADSSVMDVHFEYRVRGLWDYIYPLNDRGQIANKYPYLAATADSATIVDSLQTTPLLYFSDLFLDLYINHPTERIRYGVQVMENDGVSSYESFKVGHTYYTAIVSADGFIGNNAVYKFTWTGDDFEAYFTDEDSLYPSWEDD